MKTRRLGASPIVVSDLHGVSLIPYSPLGGGVLTGKCQGGATPRRSWCSRTT